MDIFTDASLNESKQIAGVSAVFVPSKAQKCAICHNSYLSSNNIETAELFAIAMALCMFKRHADSDIRIVSDSVGALRKIQRIFQRPDQQQIHNIEDILQKRILFNIAASIAKMRNCSFSFHHVHGHQRKAPELSDGYYNMLADMEAESGRMKGETIRLKEIRYHVGPNSFTSPEEDAVLAQQECLIVSPRQITFYYDDLPTKAKKVSTTKKEQKTSYYRRNNSRQRQ